MPRILQYFINIFNGLPQFIQIVLTLIVVGIFLKIYTNILKTGYRNDVSGSIMLPLVALSFTVFNASIFITTWIGVYFIFLYKTGRYHIIVEKITILSSFFFVPLIARTTYNILDTAGIVDLVIHLFELV